MDTNEGQKMQKETGRIKDIWYEWRFLELYIGLLRNFWRFQAVIGEITSKCSSCSLLKAGAVSSNSNAASCRGGFMEYQGVNLLAGVPFVRQVWRLA